MSQANVEAVQRIVEAFERRDWATALTGYDEDVELDQTRMPDGGVYHGHQGMREFYGRWIGSWEDFRADPVEFIAEGDKIVVIMEISGTGKTSGAAVTTPRPTSIRRWRQSRAARRLSGCLAGPSSRRAVGVGKTPLGSSSALFCGARQRRTWRSLASRSAPLNPPLPQGRVCRRVGPFPGQ